MLNKIKNIANTENKNGSKMINVTKQYMSISRDISSRILALPLYSELEKNEQKRIIKIIKGAIQ